MIVESLLIPKINNVASKLLDSGVEFIRSSHEVDVLRTISRSKIPREMLLNIATSKLLCAKSKFLASLEECKFKVLQDILEGTPLLDYLLNHARLNDSVKQC